MLLDAIWDRVLTVREHRMLYRLTLVRADRLAWIFFRLLGEANEPFDFAEPTARRLLNASLLCTFDERPHGTKNFHEAVRYYTLHPSTITYVRNRFGDHSDLRAETHLRLGGALFALSEADELDYDARHRLFLAVEAAYHYFATGDYTQAANATCRACVHLLHFGQFAEVLELIEPYEDFPVHQALPSLQQAKLFDVAVAPAESGNNSILPSGITNGASWHLGRPATLKCLRKAWPTWATSTSRCGSLRKRLPSSNRRSRSVDGKTPANRATDLGNLGVIYRGLGQVGRATQ